MDGIVGPQTWARLPEAPALPVLRRDSTGDAVRHLQEGLTKTAEGWEVDSPGAADGDFGPRTEAGFSAPCPASFHRPLPQALSDSRRCHRPRLCLGVACRR